MLRWKTVGVFGAAVAGTGILSLRRRALHAESGSDSPVSRDRPVALAFDTDGSEIRGADDDVEEAPLLKDLQLRNVQSFFRHGARTPLRILEFLDQPEWPKQKLLTDPGHLKSVNYTVIDLHGQPVPAGPYETLYQSIVFKGGSPAGQLTSFGKVQMYQLGERYRQLYMQDRKLIRPIFNARQVYVRSTNMMRTIESARWIVSGLFAHDRRGDAVVIHTEPAEREILYPNHSFCLHLKLVNKRVFRALDDIPGLKKDRLKLQKLLNYTEDAGNKKKLSFVDLRDEFAARQAHGLEIPAKARDLMEEIECYAVKMLTFMVSGSEELVLRLACGPVLHLIRDNIDSSLEQEEHYRLQLYSCHDSLLMSLLLTLGIFNQKWPPFAADLVFETYEARNGDAWVRVLYCGEPQFLPGNGSTELISLDKFKALIAPFTITTEEYREKCQDAREEQAGGQAARVTGGAK